MRKLLHILFILILVVSVTPSKVSSNDDLVIVIDAGHGGFSPGAVYGGFKEKTFNQKIVKYICDYLEKYESVKIYVTSVDDNFMSISGRVDFAAYYDADMIISVHNNAGSSSATGTTAFIPSGNYRADIAKEATELASLVLKKVNISTGLKNNGCHKRLYESQDWVFYPDGSLADYYGIVKRSIDHGIPGFIMEYAFMSNENDLNYLKKDSNLEKMGKATAEAIAEKYDLKLRTQGSYDKSHQPVKHQEEYRLITNNIQKTMTFGDKPFIIPTSGGSGNGNVVFEFDTLRVFKYIDGKIHIIGADDNIAITSTKGTDGTYLPITSNEVKISVKPKDISLSLSTVVDNHLTIICRANDLVEGFLPRGKAAFYVNGVFVERKTFKEDGSCSIVIDDPSKTYDITVKYENVTKGNYIDYYNIPNVSFKHVNNSNPTPTPSPTVSVGYTVGSTPTPTPTPTGTVGYTAGSTVGASPTETIGSTPIGTEDYTPSPTVTVGYTEGSSSSTGDTEDDAIDVYIVVLIGVVLVLIVVSSLYFVKVKNKPSE